MEPQDNIYVYDKKEEKCNKKNCYGIVATIILAAFAVVLGIIIGAVISETILGALASVIVLAIVLGLLLILTVIFIICSCKKIYKKCCKCC